MAKHLFVEGRTTTRRFTSKKIGRSPQPFNRPDVRTHEARLRQQLDAAWQAAGGSTGAVAVTGRNGVYLDFISPPGHEIFFERLESRNVGVSVRSVHHIGEGPQRQCRVTAYVTHEQRLRFLRKLHAYGTKVTPPRRNSPGGNPVNAPLMANIESVAAALVPSFWPSHEQHLIPQEDPKWCECWLVIPEEQTNASQVENLFKALAVELEISIDQKQLRFPERSIFLIKATRQQLATLIQRSDAIAEFRSAGLAADLWSGMETSEQHEWVADAVRRLNPISATAPAICVLDSGINILHQLIAPVLAVTDRHAVDTTWGLNDHTGLGGHGTGMAGLAAYGRLEPLMASTARITPTHRLESVKILPPHGANREDLYGSITAQAVSRTEVQAPLRNRSFCMAVTATRTRDMGRPTSWSGSIDALAAGRFEGDDGSQRRLFAISGGNVDQSSYSNYPTANETDSIHDPAQAWNALTVGGFTELVDLSRSGLAGHSPLAPLGGLSPHSTTAGTWERNKWPSKPDVVFEAGNRARGPTGDVIAHDSLRLLSTSNTPTIHKPLTVFDGTSAATALASNLIGRLHAAYPNAWPETIRALVVHAAEWTPAMRQQLLNPGEDETSLLPFVGWGVPSQQKAIECGRNRLTLIAQRQIQPFCFDKYDAAGVGSGRRKTKDMHLHELPWPTQALRDLGATEVRIRVTLSYFIEPSPGEKGWKNRYRYQSHGLRFEMRRPGESLSLFKDRISKAVEDDNDDDALSAAAPVPTVRPRITGDKWVLGPNSRNRGSIHSDLWRGSGADAAHCDLLAVHPVIGWWRERPHLNRVDSQTRYSLVVTIETDAQGVDIYTPVETLVSISV